MEEKDNFGEMLIAALEEAVEHHEGRMLSARDRVRRYFSPEAIAGSNSDEAEVVGLTAAVADGEVRGGR